MKVHWKTQKSVEKLKTFRKYIENNWERIVDWRDKLKNPPANARSLGTMESNTYFIPYEKRGMHWNKRKQRYVKQTVRFAHLLREQTLP